MVSLPGDPLELWLLFFGSWSLYLWCPLLSDWCPCPVLWTEAPLLDTLLLEVLVWLLVPIPLLSELSPLPWVSPMGIAFRASNADAESSSDDLLGWTGRPWAGGLFAFLGLHLWVSKLDSVLKILAQNVHTTLDPVSKDELRWVFKCWFKFDNCMNDLEQPVDGHLYGRSPVKQFKGD